MLTTCRLINHMPSIVLGHQIPYIVQSPTTPLFFLPPKIVGCVLFNLLGPRGDIIGYSHTQKGYWCYSPTLRLHFISANATFHESQPYFSPSVGSDSSLPNLLTYPSCLLL